jgi:hypothetical protein
MSAEPTEEELVDEILRLPKKPASEMTVKEARDKILDQLRPPPPRIERYRSMLKTPSVRMIPARSKEDAARNGT